MLVAAPPHPASIDVWGQPSRSAETTGRPLQSTLRLFRSGKAVTIPTWHGHRLSTLPAEMKADTGALVLAKARYVDGLYLVPTANGWLCMQGPTFQTCHAGLLRQGVTYSFAYYGDVLVVFGVAADDVARVSIGGRTAAVHDNAFTLSRPMKRAAHVPKTFGVLGIVYRDSRPPARVVIR
jgi:hypothetical protein